LRITPPITAGEHAGKFETVAQSGASEMAWETRAGTKIRYYYHARKVNGKVRKTCHGSGQRAATMARQDAKARQARAQDMKMAQQIVEELEPLERLTTHAEEQGDLLMEAALLACGFHNHRGQWRSKRHGSQNGNITEQ
jgi:hypothetical protein